MQNYVPRLCILQQAIDVAFKPVDVITASRKMTTIVVIISTTANVANFIL